MRKTSIPPANNTRHSIALVEKDCENICRAKSLRGAIQCHSMKIEDMHKTVHQQGTKMKINLDNLTIHNRCAVLKQDYE